MRFLKGDGDMQAMELAILDWIQAHLRCGPLDVLLPLISRLADHGEVWIVLEAVLLLLKGQRRYGAAVSCGLALDLVSCNMLLKPLIGRVRPFMVNTAVELLSAPPGDASFPSGHTAASFAAVFALKTAGSPLWKPALALAAVIAFSRMYLYVHWPSDILGGALLGAAVGWAGAKLVKAVENRRGH
nr:phosphatase PAP2 family protein [uncultured Dysosmobacter sp.]